MIQLLVYLFLALFVSFLCSVLESVLLSTPVSFLEAKKKAGSAAAGVFIGLKRNVEKPLAAILSLNTIAHTIGAAGVGAQATRLFGETYFGIVSAVLTLLILVFSEIIPKTIGARYWRSMAISSGITIRVLIVLTYPLVLLAGLLSNLFSSKKAEASVSREEFSALASIGSAEGVLDEQEGRIIQNVVRLKQIQVKEIMTPRVVVTVADENMTVADYLEKQEYSYHSRVPVFAGDKDHITGYVFRQEIYEMMGKGKGKMPLSEIRRPIIILPEFQTAYQCWSVLLEQKEHIALIVDEYGGMEGIVSMEDIIETMLGLEIVDERDRITDMQQFARELWEERKGGEAEQDL